MNISLVVSIDGVELRQDAEGRFCLNDLQKAATVGGATKDIRTNEWLSLRQTQDLINELRTSSDTGYSVSPRISSLEPVVIIKGGSGVQGTFVVRELVYSYAMWVSPAFHLKVIRTFDAVMTGRTSQELAPKVTDPKLAALVESLVRIDQIEQEQKLILDQQEAMKQQLENNTRCLEQIQTAINYFTVVGWASHKNMGPLPLDKAQRMGKEASAYCRQFDIETGETPDPRYGRVKTYPEWVLDQLFG